MLNRRNSTTIEFGTKAETLERLQGVLSGAVTLSQSRFAVADLQADQNECLKRIVSAIPFRVQQGDRSLIRQKPYGKSDPNSSKNFTQGVL